MASVWHLNATISYKDNTWASIAVQNNNGNYNLISGTPEQFNDLSTDPSYHEFLVLLGYPDVPVTPNPNVADVVYRFMAIETNGRILATGSTDSQPVISGNQSDLASISVALRADVIFNQTVQVTIGPPYVSPQPTAQTAFEDYSATFSATAVSAVPPTNYQWQKNRSDVSGATGNSHTTPATTLADQGALYRVRASNSAGGVYSQEVPLTVIDKLPWTARTPAELNSWNSVCWSPELHLFCAVSYNGTNRVMTSPEGVNWTAQTCPANQWMAVCWSKELGLFCATAMSGSGNRVMTSPDGITWTPQVSAADRNWFSVCWSKELGLFCAVSSGPNTGSGPGNYIMTSANGTAWTLRIAPNDGVWESVCWSKELGLFCAVSTSNHGGSDLVMTSTNGTAWTARSAPLALYSSGYKSVCWSKELGLFCAVTYSGFITSSNGIDWTARTIPVTGRFWYSICWSKELNLFCTVGTSAGMTMTSPDGINWTVRTAPGSTWTSVCWGKETDRFGAVGTGAAMTAELVSPFTSSSSSSRSSSSSSSSHSSSSSSKSSSSSSKSSSSSSSSSKSSSSSSSSITPGPQMIITISGLTGGKTFLGLGNGIHNVDPTNYQTTPEYWKWIDGTKKLSLKINAGTDLYTKIWIKDTFLELNGNWTQTGMISFSFDPIGPQSNISYRYGATTSHCFCTGSKLKDRAFGVIQTTDSITISWQRTPGWSSNSCGGPP